jgi:hypothetical protein
MTEATTITVVMGLIAVAGSLGGVWLGRHLERSNEAVKWRRERRLEAYTDLLRTCDVILFEATKAHLMAEPTPKAMAQNELVLKNVAEMHRLKDKVSLIGSAEIEGPVSELTMYYHQNMAERAVKLPKPSEDEWDKITAEAAGLYRKVVTLARTDIGVMEPPRTTWWKTSFDKSKSLFRWLVWGSYTH